MSGYPLISQCPKKSGLKKPVPPWETKPARRWQSEKNLLVEKKAFEAEQKNVG